MPPSIRTIRDLERGGAAEDDNDNGPSSTATAASKKNYKSHQKNVKIAHIPGLRDDNHAKMLLDRIYKEFLPLLQKRGYNVTSVSELCCCGDGVDHTGKARRKKKIMNANVLGYNQSMFRGRGNKSHTIHLRLRQPTNHDVFYEYESVAGTMSHELAHCEISPHNAKFYKLMEEIQEQHAVFLAKGIVADQQGFPVGTEEAYTLGGGRKKKSSLESRNAAAKAAVQRQQRQKQQGGAQRLGGSTGEFTKWMRPGEAAAMAAEQRRLQDEVWCQPCEPEIIEVSDDSSDSEEEDVMEVAVSSGSNSKQDDRKPSAKTTFKGNNQSDKKKAAGSKRESKPAQQASRQNQAAASVARMPKDSNFVDLTGSDADDEDDVAVQHRPPKQQRRTATPHFDAQEEEEWACSKCTFRNSNLALVCQMCSAGKNDYQASLELAQQLQQQSASSMEQSNPTSISNPKSRKEQIDHVKREEVAQSVRDFGFNIYGNNKESSGTMDHLT